MPALIITLAIREIPVSHAAGAVGITHWQTRDSGAGRLLLAPLPAAPVAGFSTFDPFEVPILNAWFGSKLPVREALGNVRYLRAP